MPLQTKKNQKEPFPKALNLLPKKYIPIDCNYYDVLEAFATKRTLVDILYKDEQQNPQQVQSKIVDFFILDKVEHLKLKDGQSIRLDFLISVNGLRPPEIGTCKV